APVTYSHSLPCRPRPPPLSLQRPRPPTSTLFPYTTLFRSAQRAVALERLQADDARGRLLRTRDDVRELFATSAMENTDHVGPIRSEEHTSELQSPDHLVCRLLLEKKNKMYKSRANSRLLIA